ncbi:uncharacterized protein LOC117344926 [Pecten maximus]|uniref:uncharacterized protein LOC117344926 n=1 Tax=Pecten maximus TaxID=6579 RepID=UPI0014587C3B|nr:uncharacterized protein LOC117344926 [Pecten maximus]
MTAQSVLTKGKFHDFTFRRTVSASPGNDSDAVGSSLGGRVPMYMDATAPAVIRLTHTGTNSKPTSAYSTISTRNHLFDINETIVVQESHNTGTIVGAHSDHKAAQSHSQPFIYPDRLPSRNGFITAKQSLSQIQDSRALDVADIHSLLTSDANRRPSSRILRENTSKDIKPPDHEFTDLARCKTATTLRSGFIEETDNHTCPSGHSDEDDKDKDNGDQVEDKDELEDTFPLKGNPYLQEPDIVINVPSKSSTKKGKKNKKRSKSSLSTKMKIKLQTSNRLYQQSKMKIIPPATKVKSDKENRTSANDSTFSNLSSVLQAQCKPITLVKHEQVPVSSPKHTHRSGAMSEILRPKIAQIDALKPYSKSSGGSRRAGGTDSLTSQEKLPQMTINNLVQQNSSQEPSVHMSSGSDLLSTSKSFLHNENRVTYYQTSVNEITKVTKVYLSEKHSGTMKDCGMEYPCAPPATPTPDQLKKVEYVPSMNDIRAQRAVKLKLQVLEKEASKKMEKQKEEKARQDKLQMKDREKELKMKQRNEIYALNKAMTELEQQRFQEFCSKKGIVL